MLKLWNYLDGKKTAIGAVCLCGATVITQVVIGIWNFDPTWLPKVVTTLQYIGEAFTGVGLIHKAAK